VPLNPRSVSIPLLLAFAASAGIRLELLLGGGGGTAPLLLTAVTRN
jgi:hypothetical protein